MYAMDNGSYPADTHNTLPPRMDEYINQASWDDCVVSGHFNWEGPSWGEGGAYSYAGISLYGTMAQEPIMIEIDGILDDGDLATGDFRLMPNGRYTYVLEER